MIEPVKRRRRTRRALPMVWLAACLSVPAVMAQDGEATDADPELERVVQMLDQARVEIRAFRRDGGEDEDPQHPGRRWAAELWTFREDHPGTPAADRATTEALHFMLHADQVDEAIERALALGVEDGAWPTLIRILFEAAEMREEYGFFLEKADALVAAEQDPDRRASLRFRMAQAYWVEGDDAEADAVLARLEAEAADSHWGSDAAAARDDLAHPDVRNPSRTERRTRDLWQRPGRVLDALDVEPGEQVADIGSGGGYFTFLMARRVGPTGKVYAVDIAEASLQKLAARAEELNLAQVETVLGSEKDPRLPAAELEAILVVDTYHEMTAYRAMLKGMRRALSPSGRLVIVDIHGKPGEKRKAYHERHRIPVELVIEEAARAGFRLRSFDHDFVEDPGGRRFYLVTFDQP